MLTMYLYQLPTKEFIKAQTCSADNDYTFEDYVLVDKYETDTQDTHEALEEMFEHFNGLAENKFNHRSMSVSDVVEVALNGNIHDTKIYWCDHIGFTEIEW